MRRRPWAPMRTQTKPVSCSLTQPTHLILLLARISRGPTRGPRGGLVLSYLS